MAVKVMKSIREFIADTKKTTTSSIDIFDWKENGKADIVIHPETGFSSRNVHWIPVLADKKEDVGKGKIKTTEKVFKERIICNGFESCPICQLRHKLKKDEDISDDEVILMLGSGKEYQEYTKGDLTNAKGYDWKKDIGYKSEYVFGVIDTNDVGKKVQLAIESKSLGKSLSKEIERIIDDEGEEVGDPFINPYGFRFEYDPDEQPAKQYSASRRKSIEITDEIQELLDSNGVDITQYVTPAIVTKPALILKSALNDEISIDGYDVDEFINEDDIQKIAENQFDRDLLKKILGDSYEEYVDESKLKKKEEAEEKEGETEEEKPKKPNKPNKKQEEEEEKPKKPTKTPNKKPEKEEEEKPKKPSKTPKKPIKNEPEPEPEEDMVECPNCEKQIPESAEKCEHCGVEFEADETVIICDGCNKEIPADSEECPHCGEVIIPF